MPLPFILPFMLPMMFLSEADSAVGQDFGCTNDYYSVSCQFTLSNKQTKCSEYKININTPTAEPESHIFKCEDGPTAQCKCSHGYLNLLYTIIYHNITLLRGDQQLRSIEVNTIKTLKPKRPTIIKVSKPVMGNAWVEWNTNYIYSSIYENLIGEVTYGKKGDSNKISENVSKGSYSFQMRKLDPSSTYVVTVRTRHMGNSLFSDSSDEQEFTTPPSAHTHVQSFFICLCIALIIVSCTVLYRFPKCKANYWDNIPKCHPNLLTMVPASEHMLLQPTVPVISSVSLDSTEEDVNEDKQWSEVFTDDGNHQEEESCGSTAEPSSGTHGNTISDNGDIVAHVHAALLQALPHLRTTSPASNGAHRVNDSIPTSRTISFDNETYNSFQNDVTSSSFATQTSPELPGGPAGCRRSEGDISNHSRCPTPKTQVGLETSQHVQLGPSSPVQTDILHQPRLSDSGSFSLALILEDTDVHAPCNVCVRAEAGYESFSNVVSAAGHNIPPENATPTNSNDVRDEGRLLSHPPAIVACMS